MTLSDRKGTQGSGVPPPVRLVLHGPHGVLRKIARELRVRISPGHDIHGPFVVLEAVTADEMAVITEILKA
ncbi:hypothetical protein SAMN05428995_101440 [Loktanella sp. DSM 29012]|nr:hypothetical protein SAMN05428995_101440 [Loktanella sp. DSM 29012]